MSESDIATVKKQLRRQLRQQRQQNYGGEQGQQRREAEARALLDHAGPLRDLVRDACTVHGAARVAAFHPLPGEADPVPLAAQLAEIGAELVFPAAASSELEWITWDGRSEFIASPGKGFGREPDGNRLGSDALSQAVLVLAPAVAVDAAGVRIGHGAGYYDRALPHRPASTPVVAVIHPGEFLEAGALPREPHDVLIDAVLTAEGLHVIRDHPALPPASRS